VFLVHPPDWDDSCIDEKDLKSLTCYETPTRLRRSRSRISRRPTSMKRTWGGSTFSASWTA